MTEELPSLDSPEPSPDKCKCVVRLSTSCWHNGNEVNIKRTLRYLKRKCKGFNLLDEDCRNIGAKEVVESITNLDDCEDGVYEIVTCQEWSSWETPHIIEGYKYKLIPLES